MPAVPSHSASHLSVRSEAPKGRRLLEDDSEGDLTKAPEGLSATGAVGGNNPSSGQGKIEGRHAVFGLNSYED
ncbi:hypothetical protein GUJ93_ZPchr0015g6767 [Zizania palustris]|uniref:Uncharacterized protein n=1 Tax=Zizania palustris TaxID=103762 RepID=A0A8J5W101_ZIZPA|nr:hypothetical protein GUJ93_ZPchr0015g6767 [Zizania palustris]